MTAHPTRIAHSLKTLASALIVLALSVAGYSDAQALTIDDFTDGDQTVQLNGSLSNEVPTSSGIGGWRDLEIVQGSGEVQIAEGSVDSALEQFVAFAAGPEAFGFGSTVTARWDGQGVDGLGGVNLREGGSNVFNLDTASRDDLDFSEITVRVTDTDGRVSSLNLNLNQILITEPILFPFDLLQGDAVLTSVDAIELELRLFGDNNTNPEIRINEFSTVSVPEPDTALLMGLSLACLCVLDGSRRRATHERA